MIIEVNTSNICGNPIRPKRIVRKRMRKALSRPGVNFGQECAESNRFRIGRGNYSHAWHSIASSLGKTTYGGPHEVPISLPNNLIVVDSSVPRVHEGKKRVSPARYATIVKTSNGATKVAFIDCHTVSKPRKFVPFSSWRIEHWNLYHAWLSTEVASLANEGYTVVFGGDMNKKLRGIPSIHPRQRLLASSGLDHLWVVAAEDKIFSKVSSHIIPRTVLMDHPILSVSFTLS